LGTTLLEHDNPFYVPPELLLDPSAIARRAEWMCRQLLRILEAERVRDELLAELRRRDADQRRLADDLTSIKRGLEHRLADRTAELEVANQHLAAFSYSVSHDLRAPLRAIESFSQLLAADYGARLGPDGSLHLSRVRRNARHMSKLIEGMLTFGRVVNAELNYAIIDVTALASAVVRELQDAERTRRAEIFIQPGMRAVADPTLLRSVMSNLIGNAWKFTARTPLPRVEVGHRTDPDGRVVFFVRDNGAGFDMSNASRLFGVFQRLHEQDEFPGTGVGLATVERIVKRHGGQIWAEGRPGQGATFYFTLPIRALSN
jgi:light-regulated signal transduction histidine kinase (bacteriophytochrome)